MKIGFELVCQGLCVEVVGADEKVFPLHEIWMLANGESPMEPASPFWVIDEGSRLSALAECGIMDTEEDDAFDGIVYRAAQLCETPVALVSLVSDNRQWFKAKIGFGPCETPLDQSVCKYVLDHRGVLTIPDLAVDPRTAENTLVTSDPHIRFYAGAKIKAPNGTAIGSLCVIDREPRPTGLRPTQVAALEALAAEVSSLIADRSRQSNQAD